MKRASIVLLLGAATLAGVLYYRTARKPEARARGPASALVQSAPADAQYILFVDLATLRASAFVTELWKRMPAPKQDAEYANFVRATGFDYSQDLDRVLIGARPSSSRYTTVAIAEGRFDGEKIASYALRSGRQEKQAGVNVYVVNESRPTETVAFAFPTENRVVVSEGASLASLLTPGSSTGPATAVQERLERVAGSALFAVARIDSLPKGFQTGSLKVDHLEDVLRGVRWLTLAAQPEADRMRVAVGAECETLPKTLRLYALLGTLRPLARVALADAFSRRQIQPELAAALDLILRDGKLSQEGNTVYLRFELTKAVFAENHPTPAKAQ